MERFDVVVVGSLNLDLVARTPRLPGPGETVSGSSYAEHAGGKGLNQAVAASRSGGRVAMIGAVGDDHAGRDLRAVLAADSIDDSGVRTMPDTATGRALICVDDRAENSIVVVPGANGSVTSGDVPAAAVVLAQLEVPHDAVAGRLRSARESGSLTVLNPAPAAELSHDLVGAADVVVPNEHELELVGGVERLFAGGVRHVVVTLGARGAESWSSDGGHHRVDPYPVEAVDSTGAGDAFCGTLAHRLAAGDELPVALEHAAAAGALATTVMGAVPSQPTADAVGALVEARDQLRQ